jgi:hypothetical protein
MKKKLKLIYIKKNIYIYINFLIKTFLFISFFLFLKEIYSSSKKHNKIYKFFSYKYNLFLKKETSLCIKKFLNKNTNNIKILLDEIKKIINYFKTNKMKNEFEFFTNVLNDLKNEVSIYNKKEKNKNKNKKKELKKTFIKIISKESYFNKIEKLDCIKKSFLWIIYIYPKLIKHNCFNQDEINYILIYPLNKEIENLTFKNIGINEIIEKYFNKNSKTKNIKNQALNEFSNLFTNQEMALDIIQKRSLMLDLFMDKKNKQEVKKILKKINEIQIILKLFELKNDLNKETVIDFEKINDTIKQNSNYIFFKNNKIKKNITNSKFLIKDLTSYSNYLIYFLIQSIYQYGIKNINTIDSKNDEKFKTNTLENNLYLRSFFDSFLFFSPRRTFKDVFYKNSKNFNSILLNINTIGDLYFFNIYTRKNIISEIGTPFFSLFQIYNKYSIILDKIKKIKENIFIIKEINKCFISLEKLIKRTEEIFILIDKLYKKNNISEDKYIPEFIFLKDFLNNKNNKISIKKITEYKNIFSKFKLFFKAYFLPNNFAKYYFKELNIEKILDNLISFISNIDFNLTKVYLLKNQTFCQPKIINNGSSILKLEDIWYGNLKYNEPVYNSIDLSDENSRNAIIVAPTAGGKTVMLSTIISSLYLANSGISTAKSIIYTYFYNIIENLNINYKIGSGISNNLAERNAVKRLKEILKNNENLNQKTIFLVDEMYKGTRPDLAASKALQDIKEIINNKNLIFIITTHFPELANIINNQNYNIKLYYLKVDEINNKFINTYKLHLNDKDNWWLTDYEKASRYQNYQDNLLFN